VNFRSSRLLIFRSDHHQHLCVVYGVSKCWELQKKRSDPFGTRLERLMLSLAIAVRIGGRTWRGSSWRKDRYGEEEEKEDELSPL